MDKFTLRSGYKLVHRSKMSTASTRIPAPKDWQEFERQIEVLAQCWLDDPHAKGNGRQGQRQNGVDVFGLRGGKFAVGFQCKKKFDKPITETELRSEVKKAETFRPKLKEFILVTTAPRDERIQRIARELTEESKGFSVEVWSWEDIEQLVVQHPRAARAFDPTYIPLISEELRQHSEQNSADHALLLAEVRSIKASKSARQIAEMVGMRTIAPALAANGSDLPLLADDFGIRFWARAALQVEGLWLQPILMKARDGGHLSDDDYAKAILSMADAGFNYVSLDNRTLLYALRRANFDVALIAKPLQILLGKAADLKRNLLIAVGVMIALKDEPCPTITRFRLASEIARAACYPRWSQAEEILSAVISSQTSGSVLMQEHLSEWYRWNSIGSAS